MVQGIFDDNCFMIPVGSPWHYYRPTGRRPSPSAGGEMYPQRNRCQCFDCQRPNPRQQDRRRFGEQSRTSGNNSTRRYRDVPIPFENPSKEQPQRFSRFDKARKIVSDKDHHAAALTSQDAKTGDVKKFSGNGVAETSGVENRINCPTKDRHVEELLKPSKKLDMQPEHAEEITDNIEIDVNAINDSLATPDSLHNNNLKQEKLAKINKISADVVKLAEEVEAFHGKEKCKEYLYLEEMLIKCLLKLDEVQTDGISQIRSIRKKVATTINEELRRLEEKLETSEQTQEVEKLKSVENKEDVTLSVSYKEEVKDYMNIDTKSGETLADFGSDCSCEMDKKEIDDDAISNIVQDQNSNSVDCSKQDIKKCKKEEADHLPDKKDQFSINFDMKDSETCEVDLHSGRNCTEDI